MRKTDLLPGWIHQAYRFEVDRPERVASIFSHIGARRFAWNYMLGVIEEQCRAKEVFCLLALRQGARTKEAEEWATKVCKLPYLVKMNEKRRKDHEIKVVAGKHRPSEYRPVSECCPWSAEAMRYLWNRVKDKVAPWWAENSKEGYSSAFETLAQAFTNYFASRDGTRRGPYVGWPNYKHRSGCHSVAFTTGSIWVLDRHHVQLPVIGILRIKESTDKLRLKIDGGFARILRVTLITEDAKTYVSFGVVLRWGEPRPLGMGVAGYDVGMRTLITSSDGHRVENPRAGEQVKKKISRYQRRMDRQHRVGTPRCFHPDGTHITATCYWRKHSKRARENQTKLQKAHVRTAHIRRDAIHKASYRAATTYAVDIVEDLRVEQMGRRGHGKRGFNRAIKDAVLAEFRRELSYKSTWYGSFLWLTAWWYPSSKTCSVCRKKKVKLSRGAQLFHCEHCGEEIDRDLNAAKNLAALAELSLVCLLAQISTGTPVDWSKLPIRPYGWEEDQSTRSSRGCARAEGRKANGGGRKIARASTGGDYPFDREAAEPPAEVA